MALEFDGLSHSRVHIDTAASGPNRSIPTRARAGQ